MRGTDSVVVVSQRKIQDKLVDPSSITYLFPVAKHIGVCMTGMIGDAKAAVMRARQEAANFEYENGYPIPVSYLAQRMADVAQMWTQHAFMRALGVVSIYCGIDDSSPHPQLYRVDPAGRFVAHKACSAGVKEQEANNHLEKRLKRKSELDNKEVMELAITTLQECVGSDLKPTDLEVAIVDNKTKKFTVLTEQEIDQHLSAIGDKD